MTALQNQKPKSMNQKIFCIKKNVNTSFVKKAAFYRSQK